MAFPTTGLLDDFDRADAGTLGANWSTPYEPGYGSLGILSNQAYSDATFDDAYWTASFDANQEVYVTCAVLSTGSLYVYARIQNPNSASRNAYRINQLADGSGWISKIVAGTVTALGSGWGTGSVVQGDKIGLECNGTTITAYKYSGGSWSTLDELTGESSVSGAGCIGLQIRGEASGRFDDFSGGSIVTALPQRRYKRLYGPAQLTDAAADLYTCPATTIARTLHIHASNPSGSPVDANLSIGADAAATRVWDDLAIPADGVEDVFDPYELAAGEKIQGWADTAGTVVVTITGYEDPV